jgi:ElaB/YqjD/DUF883 family membrane-anchored ribosome-binding protein
MGARRKTKTLDPRLNALRSDIDALQGDIKGLGSDAGEIANDRARSALRNAEGVAERAYRLAEDTARQTVDDVEVWANDNLDTVRDSIRSQPFAALGAALLAGAIFGAFFLRD